MTSNGRAPEPPPRDVARLLAEVQALVRRGRLGFMRTASEDLEAFGVKRWEATNLLLALTTADYVKRAPNLTAPGEDDVHVFKTVARLPGHERKRWYVKVYVSGDRRLVIQSVKPADAPPRKVY